MDIDLVRWNSNVISAKSCSFQLGGVPYTGIVALDYEDELDVEIVHGNNKDGSPIGWTSGEYKVSGFTLSVLQDVWIAKMLPQLAALSLAAGAPGSYGGARFPFTAQYQEGPLVGSDLISPCRVTKVKNGYQQGTGKLTADLTLAALTIRRSGLALFDVARIP